MCIVTYSSVEFSEGEQNVTREVDAMNNTIDIAPVNITIIAPPEVFNVSSDEVGYVLTLYSTPNLFQLKEPNGYNESISGQYEFVADSAVVGLNTSRDSKELSDLTEPVIITLQSLRAISGQVCVACKSCETLCYCLFHCISELVQTHLCCMGLQCC